MGLQDIKTEIKFGATSFCTKEEVEHYRGEIKIWRRYRIAEELGRKIAEAKGWTEREDSMGNISSINLYVFTASELKDFMDAKFKAKLRHMAQSEEYLTDHQREALIIQSERF